MQSKQENPNKTKFDAQLYHEQQIVSYEQKLSSCKTKHQMNLVLDRIENHKALAKRIELSNQLQTA